MGTLIIVLYNYNYDEHNNYNYGCVQGFAKFRVLVERSLYHIVVKCKYNYDYDEHNIIMAVCTGFCRI